MIRTTLAALALTATAATAEVVPCEVSNHNITIDFQDAQPVEGACEGVRRAIDYFAEQGYDDQTFTVNITVADPVYTYIRDLEGRDTEAVRVFGLYNGETNEITISALGTDYMRSRTAWNTVAQDDTSGRPITEEIWISVITHEVAHSLATQIFNRLNPVMVSNGYYIENGVSEYIAYLVQLSTTEPALRAEIIDSFGAVGPFQYTQNLNPFYHFAHPHRFGVQAYLTGDVWFHDALHGRIQNQMPDMF